MGRTHEQNEALARALADFFRGLLAPVAAKVKLPEDDLKLFQYTLSFLDRHQLWNLYLKERVLRDQARRVCWHADAGDLLPWPEVPIERKRTFYAHAFFARAFVAPATALRGRAFDPFIAKYIEEGIEYATQVLEIDNDAARMDLKVRWSSLAPRLDNLDTRHKGRYVPSNV